MRRVNKDHLINVSETNGSVPIYYTFVYKKYNLVFPFQQKTQAESANIAKSTRITMSNHSSPIPHLHSIPLESKNKITQFYNMKN